MDKKLLNSLRDDITNIMYDTVDLLTLIGFDKRFRNNKAPQPINAFTQVISHNSTYAMVFSICRQVDEDKNSISLINFLRKVINLSGKSQTSMFTMKQFCIDWNSFSAGVCNKTDGVSDQNTIAEYDWKQYISKEDIISIKAIQADIDELIKVTKKPKVYRNKKFAHLDKHSLKHIGRNSMIYRELYDATDTIKNIVEKYYRILHLNPISGFITDDFKNHKPISITF